MYVDHVAPKEKRVVVLWNSVLPYILQIQFHSVFCTVAFVEMENEAEAHTDEALICVREMKCDIL